MWKRWANDEETGFVDNIFNFMIISCAYLTCFPFQVSIARITCANTRVRISLDASNLKFRPKMWAVLVPPMRRTIRYMVPEVRTRTFGKFLITFHATKGGWAVASTWPSASIVVGQVWAKVELLLKCVKSLLKVLLSVTPTPITLNKNKNKTSYYYCNNNMQVLVKFCFVQHFQFFSFGSFSSSFSHKSRRRKLSKV